MIILCAWHVYLGYRDFFEPFSIPYVLFSAQYVNEQYQIKKNSNLCVGVEYFYEFIYLVHFIERTAYYTLFGCSLYLVKPIFQYCVCLSREFNIEKVDQFLLCTFVRMEWF